MDLSDEEVGPTEGTILALLDFLVDPLLPSKSSSSSREVPSLSQEQLVAKQVHAVVLLYNYYHRKRYQGLDFLDFESFCKMAVSLKPSLQSYMRLMQKADHTQVDVSDKEHSLTEKAIMNGCEICKMLDTLNTNPSMDGWPITRVAVFLVDDKKENCYLFYSSINQGVWSVIEKDDDNPSQSSEAVKPVIQSRSGDKKKRVIKRAPKENQAVNEAGLQQLAYAAVKEACGINQSDLEILENHTVYSISKEKTAVRLYIMQCTLTNQDMDLVPMNDVIESLQGPLVSKESVSWIATPVVEYFHLLPFADKVSNWMSREGLLTVSLDSEVQKEARICNSSQLSVELQPNISNNFEAINGVENHLSPIKEEPLVTVSQPVEVAMEVEQNDSSNPSNHTEAINGIEDHNSQVKEEPLVISQPVEVATEVEHNDSSNRSNHFEAINGVEDRNSQIKEEPLALMSISQPVEVAMEVEHNDSFNLKEEQLENTPQPLSEEKEVNNGSCSLKDEPCQLKDEPLSDIAQHTETTVEVEENNSSLVREGPLMETSQPCVVQKELKNGNCQLKEEHLLCNSPQSETTKEVEDGKISCRKEKPSETMVYTKRKRSQTNCNFNKSPGSKNSNAAPEDSGKQNTVTVDKMDIDVAVVTRLQANRKSKSVPCEDHVDNGKQLILAKETDPNAMARDVIVMGEVNDILPISCEHDAKRVFSDNKISATAMSIPDEKQVHALVCYESNVEHLQKIQLTIASKDTLLAETALNVLFKKRERLSQQLRSIADDIALCERSIQTISNGGGDDLAVKLDAVIEGCNSECLRIAHEPEDSTNLQIINPDLPPVKKRKRLSEASLYVCNPCQELDGICNANNWTLPTYNVCTSKGGFQASAMMKGPDFECSCEGTPCSTPLEARNLAASKLLAKLRSMAAKP